MSNNEWSDDEDNNIILQPDKSYPPSDSDSEYEEYDYSKLNCKSYTFDNLELNKKKPVSAKIKETKQKDYINWYRSDVCKQTDNLKDSNNSNNSHKWVSKRMQHKRGDKNDICKQRHFNPRLPVPNKKQIVLKIKQSNTDFILKNHNEFPKL